jgi:Zn-finger protein
MNLDILYDLLQKQYMTVELQEYISSTPVEQIRSDLAKLALEHKWKENSTFRISDKCPFCNFAILMNGGNWININNYINACSICYCPHNLCNNGTVKIQAIVESKAYRINELQKEEIEPVIKALESMIIK